MTLKIKSIVDKLLEELFDIRMAVGSYPKNDSPADREKKNFKRPGSIQTALSQASFALVSSADHLRALGELVAEGKFSFAPLTCGRIVLEASSIATWLLDLNIDSTKRVARSYAIQYSSLCEQRKIGNAKKVEKIEVRLDELESEALSLGYKTIKNRNDKRIGIGTNKPSYTKLIENQFGEGKLYRLLSGLVHSDPINLLQFGFEKVRDVEEGALMAARRPDPQAQQGFLVEMLKVHVRGEWMYIKQYGCDAEEAASVLESGFNQLRLANTDAVRFWRASLDSSNGA